MRYFPARDRADWLDFDEVTNASGLTEKRDDCSKHPAKDREEKL